MKNSPTKKQWIVAMGAAMVVAIILSLIIVSYKPKPVPRPAPAPRPVVYYDRVEIFDAQGKSSFRTPGGWSFAYALPDGTVFIKKRVKE